MKHLFSVRQHTLGVDATLLILRLVMGLAFVRHGWGKMQSPFAWMPPGAPVPGALQFLAAISEFGGGFALILGLLTRLGALGLTFTMIGAVATHLAHHEGFVTGAGHGYELPAVYLTLALFFTVGGPGGLSLDRFVFGRRH